VLVPSVGHGKGREPHVRPEIVVQLDSSAGHRGPFIELGRRHERVRYSRVDVCKACRLCVKVASRKHAGRCPEYGLYINSAAGENERAARALRFETR